MKLLLSKNNISSLPEVHVSSVTNMKELLIRNNQLSSVSNISGEYSAALLNARKNHVNYPNMCIIQVYFMLSKGALWKIVFLDNHANYLGGAN